MSKVEFVGEYYIIDRSDSMESDIIWVGANCSHP